MNVIHLERKQILEPCTLQMFNYQIDPYVGCEHRCLYCYTQNQCEVDWEYEVGVDPTLPERLEKELAPLASQTIYVGMNTDPYQPLEERHGQTRAILESLCARGFSACILTKSSLVTRDIDLLRTMPDASAGISIALQADSTRRLFEPHAIPNRDRIEALAELHESGIETYVLITPVMPFLTGVTDLIDEVRAHADTIWIYRLEIRSEEDRNWQKIRGILEQHFPRIMLEFREIVFRVDHRYWQDLRRELEILSQGEDTRLEIHV
ncbi:hypothetical protein AMJ71_00990 [candidate division TA06 bacterium SM1_40]|uniref:Radical SAM core domain-containing protein n=2 Tax=Bacteria division TA06 TaxID=1156500 RepID=A0A0S8JRU8_UNCT6|nr:MAG: hypothetical protein AMJ82_05365 [candidate division TA06 bacterium SM23_40]KPL11435.1 MAG: hypothetical protein AMJ71_00990 [candidate division TA06 bacterium SM1_40]